MAITYYFALFNLFIKWIQSKQLPFLWYCSFGLVCIRLHFYFVFWLVICQHLPHRKTFSLKEQLDWVMLNLHAGGFWNKWMLEMYNNKVKVLEYWHSAMTLFVVCVDVSGWSSAASWGSEHISLWFSICSSRDRWPTGFCAVDNGNSI